MTYREKRSTWSIGVVSGSKNFMNDIQNWLGQQIGSNAQVLNLKKRNALQIAFEGNGIAKKAVSILYDKSCVSLERKYKLAMEILS